MTNKQTWGIMGAVIGIRPQYPAPKDKGRSAIKVKIQNYLYNVQEAIETIKKRAVDDGDADLYAAIDVLSRYVDAGLMPDEAFIAAKKVVKTDALFEAWLTFALRGLIFDRSSCPIERGDKK